MYTDKFKITLLGNLYQEKKWSLVGELLDVFRRLDAEVVIPKEIDGKTVTMVGYINLPETAAKLTVPEGVYFVNEVRGVSVKEIELPSSLDVIGEGQNFTFRFCPLLEKVNLNAKMEHWDEILEAYETMYSGQGIDAAGEDNTGYTLYCTDGRIVVNY